MFNSEKLQLSDICTNVSYGYTESANEEVVGPKFLRITDIQGGVVNWENVPYCPIDDDKIGKYLLDYGDIVVARTGNSTGENYAYKGNEPSVFASYLIRFRIDKSKANPFFVWYQMRSQRWWDFVASSKSGSAQAGANAKVLGTFEVILPSLSEQNEIVCHLENIDNKIELNSQTNQTLEQIAQAIFKSWFVDFDPVKAKIAAKEAGASTEEIERAAMCAISGKTLDQLEQLSPVTLQQLQSTAALFPEALVESDLGMELPKGWKEGCIGEIAIAKGGYAFKGSCFGDEGNPVVKIKNIIGDGRVKLHDAVCIDNSQASKAKRFKLGDGDLLMAMTGATLGKIGLVVTEDRSVYLNQRVAKFESEKFGSKLSWFLYCFYQRSSIFDSVVATAHGSAQPNISSSGIESIKLVLPSDDLIRLFCRHTDSIFKKWIANIKENSILEDNRNCILPKLLSGELNTKV